MKTKTKISGTILLLAALALGCNPRGGPPGNPNPAKVDNQGSSVGAQPAPTNSVNRVDNGGSTSLAPPEGVTSPPPPATSGGTNGPPDNTASTNAPHAPAPTSGTATGSGVSLANGGAGIAQSGKTGTKLGGSQVGTTTGSTTTNSGDITIVDNGKTSSRGVTIVGGSTSTSPAKTSGYTTNQRKDVGTTSGGTTSSGGGATATTPPTPLDPLLGFQNDAEVRVEPNPNNFYNQEPAVALGNQFVLSWVSSTTPNDYKKGDIYIDLPLNDVPASDYYPYRKKVTEDNVNNNPRMAILNRSGTDPSVVDIALVWNAFRNTTPYGDPTIVRDIKYKIYRITLLKPQTASGSFKLSPFMEITSGTVASGLNDYGSQDGNWIGLDSNRGGDFVVAWADNETVDGQSFAYFNLQTFLNSGTAWAPVKTAGKIIRPNGNENPRELDNMNVALSDNSMIISFNASYPSFCSNKFRFLNKTDYTLLSNAWDYKYDNCLLPVYYKIAAEENDRFVFVYVQGDVEKYTVTHQPNGTIVGTGTASEEMANYYYREVDKDTIKTIPFTKVTLETLNKELDETYNPDLIYSLKNVVMNKSGNMMAIVNVHKQSARDVYNLIPAIFPTTPPSFKLLSKDPQGFLYGSQANTNAMAISDTRYAICYTKMTGIFCNSWQ